MLGIGTKVEMVMAGVDRDGRRWLGGRPRLWGQIAAVSENRQV